MSYIVTDTLQERVTRGIEWMNKNLGSDWPEFIDRETLDMGKVGRCILGQTFGDYWDASRAMGGEQWARDHGFQEDWRADLDHQDLQAEWERYLDEYEDAQL